MPLVAAFSPSFDQTSRQYEASESNVQTSYGADQSLINAEDVGHGATADAGHNVRTPHTEAPGENAQAAGNRFLQNQTLTKPPAAWVDKLTVCASNGSNWSG